FRSVQAVDLDHADAGPGAGADGHARCQDQAHGQHGPLAELGDGFDYDGFKGHIPMSDSRSRSPDPRPALDALMAEPAGDPLRRALWLDALDRRLRPCLPPSIAAHA